MAEEFETVTVAQLDTFTLALTNFFAHSNVNGKLGKSTLNDLANFLAPFVASTSSAGFIPVSGTILPSLGDQATAYTLLGAGTYTQSNGGTITTTELLNIVSWNGESWFLTKAISLGGTPIDNLTTLDKNRSLSASMGATLLSKINESSKYGTPTDVTGPLTANKVFTANGNFTANAGYSDCDWIPVTPGEVITISLTCLGSALSATTPQPTSGLAGYSAKSISSFVTDPDSTGKPKGAIWDNDRWAIENNQPFIVGTGNKSYTNIKRVIPDGVYFVKGCTLSSLTGYVPLKIVKNIYSDSDLTVKQDFLSTKEKGIAISGNTKKTLAEVLINTVYPKTFISATLTKTLKILEANTGILSSNTGWEANNIIPVIPGSLLRYSGVLGGSRINASFVTGISGYDANGIFLSTIDLTGYPIGEILSNDRYAQLTNTTASATRRTYTDFEVKIPVGCYFVIATSAITGAPSTPLVLSFPDYDSPANTTIKEEVDTLKKQVAASAYKDTIAGIAKAYTRSNVQRFSFIQCTDVHYNSLNSDINLAELIDFSKHPLIASDISAIMFTGDASNGSIGRAKATTLTEANLFMTRLLTSTVKVEFNMGNHDNNINFGSGVSPTTAFANALTDAEQYATYIQPLANKWTGYVTQPNKCYYYSDYTAFKIRIISVDLYTQPLVNNGDGSIKYTSGFANYYSQAQLDWLYTTLRSTPNDYGVIVLHHAPLTTGYTVGNYMQGVSLIPSIINAWKNAGSFNHSYNGGANPELATAKNFDFTADTPKEFICYLGGHTHSLNYIKVDNFSDQNFIVMPCLFTATATFSNDAAKNSTLVRGDNNETRNSFGFISVERVTRKVIVTMFGAYRDSDGVVTDRVKVLSY